MSLNFLYNINKIVYIYLSYPKLVNYRKKQKQNNTFYIFGCPAQVSHEFLFIVFF
jgi:hypothetical protein